MALVNGLRFDNIRGDIFGGLTAAVVALPLALAFGVASGAGPIAGLYGAIIVGFFAAVFGGTPAQVSGPTGPMTVVMAAVVARYAHEPSMAFTVVMMGGLVQMAFGKLRLGRYVTYVPFSVISGFMSGIGLIIIALQLGPLLGHEASSKGVLAAIGDLPAVFANPGTDALIVGAVSLAIVFLLPKPLARYVPSPLVALIVGTILVWFWLPAAPILGAIPSGLPTPHLPTFDLEALPGMLRSALVLGLLGSIDSLLTSLIADNITRTQHDSDRELLGQGLGNIVAGLFGAIPGAGATMRTVINVRAGGRTPISGAVHALVLLAIALGLGDLAAHIPHAVLAGILIKVGLDIIDWDYVRRLRRAPKAGVLVMSTVLVLTVAVDLITAVAVGIIMASLISAKSLSEHQLAQLRLVSSDTDETPLSPTERSLIKEAAGRLLLVHLSGPFSFCSAKDMVRRTIGLQDYAAVVFDFSDVKMFETSTAMAIEELFLQASGPDRRVYVAGINSRGAEVLKRMRVMEKIPTDRQHDTREAALQAAVAGLVETPPA